MLKPFTIDRRYQFFIYASAAIIMILAFQIVTAQSIKLSIKQTVSKVEANLPALEALRQQSAAARQNIALAKNTLVPDLTAGYQVNMATYNNITGMSYPGFLLPISGPPSASNELNFIPGSAVGALLKWNPLTFGQRAAAIEKASAQFKQVNANYNEQLFRYQYAAINAYLESIYYRQLLKSFHAAIERNSVGLQQSLVLAKTGLRPGIDSAQFQSTIAQSEIDLLQTERSYQQQINELSRLTGIDSSFKNFLLIDTLFTAQVNQLMDTVVNITNHPFYKTLEAQKNITLADLREIQKSWVPHLDIWGNVYARGSGIDASGRIHKSDGLTLTRTNAGIGVQVSFPILQYSRVTIKKHQYNFFLKADESRLAQAQLDISNQLSIALEQFRQDIKIAGKSPVLLKAASDVFEGLKLSYEMGLIDYTRLSLAQFELLKAEVNESNAGLQLWRSLLAVAVAKGDLNFFIDQLK